MYLALAHNIVMLNVYGSLICNFYVNYFVDYQYMDQV